MRHVRSVKRFHTATRPNYNEDLSEFPKAILLDFDGTLVDSEPLHYRCWCEAVRPWGASTDWEDYQARFVGITDREGARIFLSEAGHEPTDELIRVACDSKHRLYRSLSGGELKIPEATISIIVELALLVPVGVVTSSIESELRPVLVKAELDGLMSIMVCGDHVSRHKPDPEPYQLALNRLNQLGFFDSCEPMCRVRGFGCRDGRGDLRGHAGLASAASIGAG